MFDEVQDEHFIFTDNEFVINGFPVVSPPGPANQGQTSTQNQGQTSAQNQGQASTQNQGQTEVEDVDLEKIEDEDEPIGKEDIEEDDEQEETDSDKQLLNMNISDMTDEQYERYIQILSEE